MRKTAALGPVGGAPRLRIRPGILLAGATLAALAAGAWASEPTAAGFSGTWRLSAESGDVSAPPSRDGWALSPSRSADRARPVGGGFDLPLEVMVDAHRLVVSDDGTTLRATYPKGRVRSFVTDGQKRYVDDGDGPADVTCRRKGSEVTVSSEWRRGYKLRETWELRASPRRLVVTGRLRGRESQEYVRTYEPAPPGEEPTPAVPSPTPRPSPRPDLVPAVPAPAASPGPVPPAVGPTFHDRLDECSIRPPKGARPAELTALAKVPQAEASRSALASMGSARPSGVISSDLEVFDGCLVWPFTLRFPERGGVVEAFVDAGDGKVVKSEFVRTGPAAPGSP